MYRQIFCSPDNRVKGLGFRVLTHPAGWLKVTPMADSNDGSVLLGGGVPLSGPLSDASCKAMLKNEPFFMTIMTMQ